MVRLSLLVSSLASFVAVSAHPTTNIVTVPKFGCPVAPTDAFRETMREFAALEANGTAAGASTIGARATITIPTYFHVVAKSTSLSGGYIPTSQLTNQLAVMNSNYAPHGIQFSLVSTDYTVNTAWATGSSGELAMKKALRKGDYKSLNLYFQFQLQDQAFGYCYYPTTVTSRTSNNFYYDGCNILYSTVPGGSFTDYNLGKTVTHEVGHWFGLAHTFGEPPSGAGSCSETYGDSVSDTPAQYSPSSGCPTGRDSCPAAGVDPIHNYMDYSVDSCYEEFTVGQRTRMTSMYNTYRLNSV